MAQLPWCNRRRRSVCRRNFWPRCSGCAAKNAAFTGVKGQLTWSQAGGNTLVQGDIDGNKVADFQIELTGLKTLTAADFIL